MFTVYVLRCQDGSFYIGHTHDLAGRLIEHRNGRVVWTRSRRPVTLVHSEELPSRQQAIRREKELKTGYGRKWIKRKFS